MTDDSDNDIVVAFSYSTRQHTKALEQMRELRLLQYLCLFVGVMYFGTTGYEWIQGESTLPTSRLWSISLSVFMLGVTTLPYWMLRAWARQIDSMKQDGEAETFRFNRDGFALSSGAPLTPWGLMDSITEVKGGFLLRDALTNWPVYMPTSAISPSDLEKLRGIVRAEFSSRPKNLKLLPAQ
jgi:hypothetical protein